MLLYALVFVYSFLVYVVLVLGSGGVLSPSEVVMGLVVSAVVSAISYRILDGRDFRMLNPKRWVLFLAYLFPFFLAMAKANLDVAYRVITGKIRPGIVRIRTGLKTDLAITMLANSITLTPGTLTVDVLEDENELFVHWIYVKEGAEREEYVDPRLVCRNFHFWARRVAD